MTITQTHLQGAHEPYAETIRALLARNWSISPTPRIISDFGVGTATANLDSPLTANDHSLTHDEPGVILRDGESAVETSTNIFVSGTTDVHIDVYGPPKFRELAEREIDRIIFENQPDSSTRINKSDNTNSSGICYFHNYILSWERVTDLADMGIVAQSAAILTVGWERTKS